MAVESDFVIEFDLDEIDQVTRKPVTRHCTVRPCGGEKEAEATAKNLKLNKRVRNLSTKKDG